MIRKKRLRDIIKYAKYKALLQNINNTSKITAGEIASTFAIITFIFPISKYLLSVLAIRYVNSPLNTVLEVANSDKAFGTTISYTIFSLASAYILTIVSDSLSRICHNLQSCLDNIINFKLYNLIKYFFIGAFISIGLVSFFYHIYNHTVIIYFILSIVTLIALVISVQLYRHKDNYTLKQYTIYKRVFIVIVTISSYIGIYIYIDKVINSLDIISLVYLFTVMFILLLLAAVCNKPKFTNIAFFNTSHIFISGILLTVIIAQSLPDIDNRKEQIYLIYYLDKDNQQQHYQISPKNYKIENDFVTIFKNGHISEIIPKNRILYYERYKDNTSLHD